MTHRYTALTGQRARLVGAVATAASLAFAFACAEPSSPAATSAPTAGLSASRVEPSVRDDLARLRSAVAKFHNVEAARDAGYTIQLTGCMEDARFGGMGFHYGKGSAINGTVDPLEPEALLYEPESNGKLRLVAVEFLVPYDFQPREGKAPEAFGLPFARNDTFKVWALHAWIFKHNPSGMFADWNPTVNCDAVPAAARMTHGH